MRKTRVCAISHDSKNSLTSAQPVQRLLWFVKAMDENRARLSVAEMHEICEKFLARLDEDLEQERAARRSGRPMSKHQEELEAAKTREAHEYAKEGLGRFATWPASRTSVLRFMHTPVLPDLTDESSVVSVRYWLHTLQGKPGYLTCVSFHQIYLFSAADAALPQSLAPGTRL